MGNRNSGPRPKPNALKVLRGVRKDRLNPGEPVPPPLPIRRKRLAGYAARAWRELAPICLAMGTLTSADQQAFGMLCELVATAELIAKEKRDPAFKPLVMKAKVDGDGNVHLEAHENPLLRMERQTAMVLRPYFEKFGLEPVGRARIHVHTDPAYAAKAQEPLSKWAGKLA